MGRITALAFSALLLLSCAPKATLRGQGDPQIGLTISWLGHSCFSFQDSARRVFLIDPYDDTIGYDFRWVKPDAILITHDHFDHNYLRHTQANEILRSTGTKTVVGIEVIGLLADHDNEGGRRHGQTRMYVWNMGGLKLAHLGDIGQDHLMSDQLDALQGVDILFIPVGGKTTVDAAGAKRLVDQIRPKVIVPMHYGNVDVRFFEFDPVDRFLKLFPDVLEMPDSEFQLRRSNLPAVPTVYLPAMPGPEL